MQVAENYTIFTSMTLLSGFTDSAVMVIFALYLLMALVVYGVLFAILYNFPSFNRWRARLKAKSLALYWGGLFLLYVVSLLLTTAFIVIRQQIVGEGLLE